MRSSAAATTDPGSDDDPPELTDSDDSEDEGRPRGIGLKTKNFKATKASVARDAATFQHLRNSSLKDEDQYELAGDHGDGGKRERTSTTKRDQSVYDVNPSGRIRCKECSSRPFKAVFNLCDHLRSHESRDPQGPMIDTSKYQDLNVFRCESCKKITGDRNHSRKCKGSSSSAAAGTKGEDEPTTIAEDAALS